jgi:hypothetical protein
MDNKEEGRIIASYSSSRVKGSRENALKKWGTLYQLPLLV